MLHWKQLPSLPDREGFAAPFAGVAGDALLVGGGANFPGKRPWEGGEKNWYDSLFVLDAPDGHWVAAGRLPRAAAYGVSVTTTTGVVCAGGADARAHSRDVYLLDWDGHKVNIRELPTLPRACAYANGAVVDGIFYLEGGTEKPDAVEAMKTFWALDLRQPGAAWRELPPCPGPARMLAAAGGHAGTFYLFGGVALHPGDDGRPLRTYLRDAYAFTPSSGWRRLPDLPHPVAGAASPAPVTGDGRLLVLAGDDGTRLHLNGPHHPGFQREILAYDPALCAWSVVGEAPFSRATVPTAFWRGQWIVPSGERIPGVRSPEVWALGVEP